MGSCDDPLVGYERASTEMRFVNPHRYLQISNDGNCIFNKQSLTCQGYSFTLVSFPYRILPFWRLDLPSGGTWILEKSRVCLVKLGLNISVRTLQTLPSQHAGGLNYYREMDIK